MIADISKRITPIDGELKVCRSIMRRTQIIKKEEKHRQLEMERNQNLSSNRKMEKCK